MKSRFLCAAALFLSAAAALQAARHEPYDRSRIYWDPYTRVDAIGWGGNYGRMVQLLDGRLMIVARYNGGLCYTVSSDYGAHWGEPVMIVRNPAGFDYGSPDFTQLADGTILVGLNPRPNEPYSEDRKFGIRVVRSTDNGLTWSEPIFVFDAEYYGEDGCWEPSFLQLPSGEVHCYYSVELKGSNDQEIMISRSFDNGLTWGPAERVCYRSGYRDGMATAIVTDAQEIVGIIEDFGHPNCIWSARATTFRCSLEDNWKNWVDASSADREMIFESAAEKKFHSAAPYIRKLPGGETIASWMGNNDGRATLEIDKFPLFVAVGDADARNFKAVNMPFYRTETQFANWGSVGVADDGYVYALANVGEYGGGCVLGLVKGMPRKGFEASFGTPVLDGSPAKDPWAYENGRQLTMGTQTGNRFSADFLYDNENLYVYAYAQDPEIIKDTVDKDGVFLYLDVAGCCDTYPQTGMFRFFFGTDGVATLRCGANDKWQPEAEAEGVSYTLKCGTKYYMMEVAIPWSVLGETGAPSPDREMRVNVQVRDSRARSLAYESIPETIDKSSWTWPEFRLNPPAGVQAPEMASRSGLSFRREGHDVIFTADKPIVAAVAYTVSGSLAASSAGDRLSLPAAGIYMIGVRYADGSVQYRKIAI